MDWIRVDEEPRPIRCHRMSGIAWNRDPYSFNQGADTCLSHCTKFVGMTRWIIVLLVFACELRCFVNSTMGRPRNPECPPPPPPGPPPVPCSGRGPLVDPSTGEDRLCTSAELRSAILKVSYIYVCFFHSSAFIVVLANEHGHLVPAAFHWAEVSGKESSSKIAKMSLPIPSPFQVSFYKPQYVFLKTTLTPINLMTAEFLLTTVNLVLCQQFHAPTALAYSTAPIGLQPDGT